MQCKITSAVYDMKHLSSMRMMLSQLANCSYVGICKYNFSRKGEPVVHIGREGALSETKKTDGGVDGF